MPFENPHTGQEFEDFADCVQTVTEWDGVESEDEAEQMCGAWQAETKDNSIRYNAQDPTETSRARKQFQDELVRRLESVADSVSTWFGSHDVELQTIRLRFTQWLRTRLFEDVLEQTQDDSVASGHHWTATYIREAYRRGLDLAARDLATIDEYDRFRIEQHTRFRKEVHQDHVKREYNQAYAGFEDQLFRAVDTIGAILREGVNGEESDEWFIEEITEYITTDMVNAARAHANTVVVDAVNEGLLTTFETIGVESVGVAPESDAGADVTNYIRVNEDFRDPSDPRNPDEAQWVTAGDDAVCDVCQALEGTVVKIENVRGNDQFQPPIHPNCRCRLVPLPPET